MSIGWDTTQQSKELPTDMCDITDTSQKQCVLWKKPDRKEYKLYDSISMKL